MIADHLDGRVSNIYPSNITKNIKQQIRIENITFNNLDFDYSKIARIQALNKFNKNIDKIDCEIKKLSLAREWLEDLKNIYSKDRYLAIDQPILLGQHFNIWPKVFDPFKMIIVYRDPRDQLAEIIRQNHLFLHMRSPDADIYGGDRFGAIKYQIETLEARYKWVEKIQKKLGDEKVLLINFEDFIINNKEHRSKIEKWLGLNTKDKVKKVLEPNLSIKNIGIYKEHLKDREINLLDNLYKKYLDSNI